MATERPDTRDEARNALIAALQDNARALRAASAQGNQQAVAELQQRDSQLQAQLRGAGALGALGGGIASAGVGLLTGIPDLVISGYNSAANPTVPMQTLRERVLNAAQIPTEASSVEDQGTYAAPEIGTAVAGLAQLSKLGFKGVTSWLKQRKVDNLLSKLPEEEANRFKEYMLRGQGSASTEVAAKINELRRNPKYTELFNELDNAATKAATQGMAPRPSRIAEPEAAQNMAKAVEERLKSVRKARSEAGNTNFTKAFEQGGDRAILTPSKTIETIDDLVKNTDTSTDSGKAAVKWLQETRDNIAPRINVAPRAGTSYTSPQAARDTLTNAPIPGQEVTYNIPGSAGYTIQQSPKALTVQEVQARLKEWGRNAASEGSAVRDLAISDEQRINAALFGAMKDDLKAAQSSATTTADKKALGYLEQARSQTSKASKEYNELIAQGMPTFLKGKPIESISFEELSGAYKNLNPSQRAVFRDWVGQNKAESLQAIDSDVFQTFKAKHVGSLPDGTQGVDLKSMAEDWSKMSPKDQNILAAALGQNFNEFNGRMKDALVFTRRIQTGSLAAEGQAAQEATTAGARVAGATLGYRFNQAVKLLGDAFGTANKGIISDELAFKTLLTPEGANFLKTAKLTPGSQKTLEALTNMNNAVPKIPEYIKPVAQVAGAIAPQVTAPPETTDQPTWELPPEQTQNTGEVKWELPPEDVNVQNPELGLNAGDISPRQSPFTGVNPQLQPY
jgi:hypothetical protein